MSAEDENKHNKTAVAAARSLLVTYLRQPSSSAELKAGQQVFGSEEVQRFLAAQGSSSPSDKDETLRKFVSLIPEIDYFHAGMLSLICGSLVEDGAAAAVAPLLLSAVMGLLAEQLRKIKDYVDTGEDLDADERFQKFPEAARAQAGLGFTIPPAMTMLARNKEGRKEWQSHQDLVELVDELEDAEIVPFYLKRVLSLLDDKDLVVLDKSGGRAFLVRLVGVQDFMCHCFALLQHAILQHEGPGYLDAEPTDPLAVRYAQNKGLTRADYAHPGGILESPRFDFCYPGGLWIPISLTFSELPTFQGTAFLVIVKKGTARSPQLSWDARNVYPVLHEALQSRVDVVRELTGEELKSWLAILSA